MARYGEAQAKATMKYMSNNCERINLLLKKGEKGRYREYADGVGMSLNRFIIEAIEEKIERLERGEN